LEQLHRDWRRTAEIAFDRYRAELPMQSIMERVLDESQPAAR
jgi:hypothetical protein